MRKAIWMILAGLAPFLFSGCAPLTTTVKPPESKQREGVAPLSQYGWWYARFQIHWPENEEPLWHTDLVLAHRIIAPLIPEYKEKVELWRFHRRAARDQAGHQFSFIFYSSPQAAEEIFEKLSSDPLLKEMKEKGILTEYHYDDTGTILRPFVDGTSDSRWSLPVQRSWPYYIMGVCEMWLHLISEIFEQLPSYLKNGSTPEDCLVTYQRVNQSITETWRKEGRHAFLHHLNAIFGYEPVVIREERLMGF